jgi:uncharacterized delta-60 repeat protein
MFGSGGKVLGPEGGAYALALEGDGKVIVGGSGATIDFPFTLMGLNADGSLDSGFGQGGVVETPSFPTSHSAAHVRSLAVDNDGKIVAGGTIEDVDFSYFGLARYNSDGSLDRSFGSGGTVATMADLGQSNQSQLSAIALQPDGKIVAAGSSPTSFILARYNHDGSLDKTFGTGGLVSTPSTPFAVGGAAAVVVQPDGGIVAAGYPNSGGAASTLVRYLPNGFLDRSFGSGGIVLTKTAGYATVHALVLQPDGKLVAAGGASDPSLGGGIRFALARYNTDGSPDTDFGSNGVVFGNANGAEANAIVLQPDGKLVVAGYQLGTEPSPDYFSETRYFALARYQSNGSPDRSFGSGGSVITRIGSSIYAQAQALVLQADGRLVAAGLAVDGVHVNPGGGRSPITRFGVVRYLADDIPPPTPTSYPRRTVLRARLSALRLSPRTFRAAPRGPSALRARVGRQRYGTRVRFRLNRSAQVHFKVKWLRPKPCRRGAARSHRDTRKRACSRTRVVRGTFVRRGRQGLNRFRFTGRLAGGRLKPGSFELIATPTASGAFGRAASARFTITT